MVFSDMWVQAFWGYALMTVVYGPVLNRLKLFFQVDEERGGRFLPRGVHFRRGVRSGPRPFRLDQVPGHGSAAQEDGRESAEVPVRLHHHVPQSLPATAQRIR